MSAILDLLTGDLGKWVAGALVALFGALGLYAKGRSDANRKADARAMKDTIKSYEARNDANAEADADPDPRDSLRKDWRR